MAKTELTHVEGFSQHLSSYCISCLPELVAWMSAFFSKAQQTARVFQTYDERWIEEKAQLGMGLKIGV